MASSGERFLTLALAQCKHPADGNVLALVSNWMKRACDAGAQMVVFPECLMTPFEKTPEEFRETAQAIDGEFVTGVSAIAKQAGTWIVFTMNEANPAGGQPFNTAVVVDDAGAVRGTYRKTHLFDALSFKESGKVSAGNAVLDPIETPWGKLGLAICYDLRFPEVARKQALAGCDLMIFSSAWVTGKGKIAQFRTLVGVRAIENNMYVAGLSRPDEGYTGSSLIAGPRGEVFASAENGEELVVATLDFEDLQLARQQIPVLSQRRPELYI